MAYQSPEAKKYIANVMHTTRELGIEKDSVLVGSGAMYLGAQAVDMACRFPDRDLDITVASDRLDGVIRNLQDAREFTTAEGHWYSGRFGNVQIDVGDRWGDLPYRAVLAGAQFTPKGVAFASLNDIRKYKERRFRRTATPKDKQDIEFIDSLLDGFRHRKGNLGLHCTAEAALGNTDASSSARQVLPGSLEAPISKGEANILKNIGNKGLALIGARYGTGLLEGAEYPGYRFEPDHHPLNEKILWWNTRRHGIEVGKDAFLLACELRLGSLACNTFSMAGNWHDVIQRGVIKDPTKRDGKDELMSAQELIEILRRQGLSQPVALLAAYFIQGTQVTTEGSRVTGQAGAKFDQGMYPTREAMMAAGIGSGSDMGRIYKGNYRPALGLFAQRIGIFPPHVPDLSNPKIRKELGQFLEGQLGFLSGYRFALKEAERLFANDGRRDYRSERLRLVEALLRQQQNDETPDNWWAFVEQKVKI
jgi:hypothetical protein